MIRHYQIYQINWIIEYIELIYYFQIKAFFYKLVIHWSVLGMQMNQGGVFQQTTRCRASQQSPLLWLSSGQVFNSGWNPEFQMDSGFLSLTWRQEYSALNTLIFLVWLDVSGHKQHVPQPSWVHNPKINRKEETDMGKKFRALIPQVQNQRNWMISSTWNYQAV